MLRCAFITMSVVLIDNGLLELGELGGLWKNVAGRYEIDGKKVYAKAIYKDPEQYFTPEVMEKLDERRTGYGIRM